MSAAFILPPVTEKILGSISLAVIRPTVARFLLMVIGLILTFGHRRPLGVRAIASCDSSRGSPASGTASAAVTTGTRITGIVKYRFSIDSDL